jgi:PAS domain S-box-containing protein
MNEKTNIMDAHLSWQQWIDTLDELGIGAFVADANRLISAINYTAQAIMELKESEVIGKGCQEIFTGVLCTGSCIFSKKGDSQKDAAIPKISHEDNDRHRVTRFATPIYGPDDELAGCLTLLQDHSPVYDLIERVHYEERSLKITLDNLDIGIFTVNKGGLITFFNTGAEIITGYDRKEVLGQHFSMLSEAHSSKDYDLLLAAISTGKPQISNNGKISDSNNTSLPVKAKYLALRNEKGTIVGGLVTFQDLTLVHQFNKAVNNAYTFHDMVGKDPAIQKIFKMVSVISGSDATILLEGVTGTGKDLLAKVIHTTSSRSKKPFVKVNCAALPENLMESEIFGYAKGAFTGADRDKPGRFQDAAGGTIFLDEIGDLPLSLQAKLLRVLEDKEFYPLGSRKTQKVDVRIISATNRGLGKMVDQGLFRADLYYRLNVMRIHLPPLKNRKADLPLLIRHITRQLCATSNCRLPVISGSAMKILLNFDYPGNIRELENILEHALIICKDDLIMPEHLPDYTSRKNNPPKTGVDLSPFEIKDRNKILKVLQHHNGHRINAAAALAMDRTTLWRKMKKYDLET